MNANICIANWNSGYFLPISCEFFGTYFRFLNLLKLDLRLCSEINLIEKQFKILTGTIYEDIKFLHILPVGFHLRCFLENDSIFCGGWNRNSIATRLNCEAEENSDFGLRIGKAFHHEKTLYPTCLLTWIEYLQSHIFK